MALPDSDAIIKVLEEAFAKAIKEPELCDLGPKEDDRDCPAKSRRIPEGD